MTHLELTQNNQQEQEYFQSGKYFCNKCGRRKMVGICTGCGEYASHGKCECEPLPIQNKKIEI